MKARDRWPAAVLTLFGVLALTEARSLRFGTITAPGPGFFPVCLAALLALVGAVLFLRALGGARPGGAEAPAGRPAPGGAGAAGRVKAVGTLAALALYAALLEPVGFVIATFLLLLFFFRVLEGHRWPAAVTASLATSLLTWVVFAHWLHVRLPGGVLRP